MTEARFCGVCGWPLKAAAVCEACEAPAGTGQKAGEDEANLWILGGPRPEEYPDLKNAFLAWKQKDWPRLVGQCLVALGVDAPQITNLPEGPGWSFLQDSAVIYISLDKARGELAIESPMVRLPALKRIEGRLASSINRSNPGVGGRLVLVRQDGAAVPAADCQALQALQADLMILDGLLWLGGIVIPAYGVAAALVAILIGLVQLVLATLCA